MVLVVIGTIYIVFSFDSSPPKRLVPDSALAEVVLRSPEAKAFLARYPDSETYVFQDFDLPDCCDVTLSHLRYNATVHIPRITLDAKVNVSADLKDVTISEMRLECHISEGVWTVRGDIVQNLQAENPDCWELGVPPRPADDELVRRAKATEEARVFFHSYPDSTVSIRLEDTPSNQPEVVFTPTTEDRIKYGVTFSGLDWNVDEIWVVCSNGDQTWYRLADEHDFWKYFQPEEGDCWDYPPAK